MEPADQAQRGRGPLGGPWDRVKTTSRLPVRLVWAKSPWDDDADRSSWTFAGGTAPCLGCDSVTDSPWGLLRGEDI